MPEHTLAVVVPTIRQTCLQRFLEHWKSLLIKHNALLLVVTDGPVPMLNVRGTATSITVDDIMGPDSDLIFNFTDSVRNMAFAYIAKNLSTIATIVTLDDDVIPNGNDPIAEHLAVLSERVPISWINTASEYMRGFPYAVRNEAEVWVSHGVWHGIKDYDAPTQLVNGNRDATFFKGPVPKGILAPVCGMNLAFKREALPYVYYAPMGERAMNLHRFGDIWMGINLKQRLDTLGKALVTGYSSVWHERASNVFTNLQREALGIHLNESYWTGDSTHPYFTLYHQLLSRWTLLINKHIETADKHTQNNG